MTTLQIKKSINRMKESDRLFAAAYLKHLARYADPGHREKLGARMRRMDAGKKVGLEMLKRLHKELQAAGV